MNNDVPARARELGARLREAREAKGVSNNQMADELGWSQGTTSRFETGHREVSTLNVATILGYCGMSRAERAAILELTDNSRDGCWPRPHGDLLPEAAPSVLFQYRHAAAITCYAPNGIPPMLQTVDFIEAELRHRFGPDDAGVVRGAEVRRDYREILIKPDRPAVVCYLNETTLRRLPVDNDTRWSQYFGLSLAIGSDEAQVRVIPTNRERAIEAGGFSLLRFKEFPALVCRPVETATLILEGTDHVQRYERILTDLDKIALSVPDSRNVITNLVAESEKLTTPPPGALTTSADDAGSRITG
jgi:transcriptional regulator with XRE-family HTH domain